MIQRLLAVSVVAAGCAGGIFATAADLEELRKTPDQRFSERWAGQSEDDVMVKYGKPFEVIPLSNGNRLDSYRREIAISESEGSGAAYGGIAGASHRAESTTIYCDRRFEIDKSTLRVVRATITGNRCDYSQ